MWRICKSAVTSAEHLLSWETPAVEHPYSLGNQATSPRICTDTTTQLQNTTGRKIVKIKDIFDERSEKGFDELELLSVTLNEGVIKRSEIESKDNSNDNKSNYKHVLPNDMVYNSMRMWQGASGVSSYEGIVSPAYTILIPKNVHSPFFGYYFKTHEMIYQFKKYSQGLTSDTWNLKYPLISEINLRNNFCHR